jgi:prepilin-type N-terminal cleavage/methylation domain-containing protein
MISPVKPEVSGRQQPGFSLLELLVVLILLGIMAGIAGPATGRFLSSLDFKKQTAEFMKVIRYARLMAVTEGKSVTMTTAEGSKALVLSGGVEENRDLGLADNDTLELEPEEIIFFPEGYATPGTLVFTRHEKMQKIIIDPMTALPIIDYSDDN